MEKKNATNLKRFLDSKVAEFNNSSFIKDDPVCIPHLFSKKEDIEIAGFFAAIFAWGNRKTIINKSKLLLQLMDNAPHDFCLHHSNNDLKKLVGFCHRTFNDTDLLYFISFFKSHYSKYGSLEEAFFNQKILEVPGDLTLVERSLNHFNSYFFLPDEAPSRTKKHIASPQKNSSCKRLNLFLRWMVRKDDKGVDFGLWEKISSSQLICPVDVHVARVARHFNLLKRTPVDWQAAIELTQQLRKFDKNDPVKYDFALFGLGVLEKY